MKSYIFSETYKRPLKPRSESDQDSIQADKQNETNFITLGKIYENDKIEIIQTGFQFNQEGKISLKKYYESTAEY